MKYPQFVIVNDKKYKINTNFWVAIECNVIAQDKNINDLERALAIIYKLYGDEGIDNPEDYEKLLELGRKYLLCGKEFNLDNDEQPDMDYVEDYSFIKTSFRSDYGINLDKEDMHWWEFYDLLCGLSNSELGNCCILNRIRNLRNYDVSKIKDDKIRQETKKAQENFALKKYKKENNLTEEQEESIRLFHEQAGI